MSRRAIAETSSVSVKVQYVILNEVKNLFRFPFPQMRLYVVSVWATFKRIIPPCDQTHKQLIVALCCLCVHAERYNI